MSKLKELKEKLNLKVALISGVVVVSTSLGTCHFMGPGEEAEVVEAPAPEPAPAEAPEEAAAEE
jgi:hypothetical protein|tara:strand:- start:569 stop:760 length:192 start_codon:yes stop_codon:yes gene_type:complete